MKVSINLSEEDVALVDAHARKAGLPSRSAAIHQAVRLLGAAELEDAYAEAWNEWNESADRAEWESAAADGMA